MHADLLISDLLFTIISINVRGIKSNIDYVTYLITQYKSPLIVCLSEHWLHRYDSNYLSKINGSFGYVAESIVEEDTYIPRLIRGRSGVAILWSPDINHLISSISHPRNNRLVGIRIKSHPCRTGCTDVFREALDVLDSTLTLFPGSIILFAGDLNANPGSIGGPRGTLPNEQGLILARYLTEWDYVSTHLHFYFPTPIHTYFSEAHGSFAAIDHILCPCFFLSRFASALVSPEHPLNTSDHYPIIVQLRIPCPNEVPADAHTPAPKPVVPNWSKCDGIIHDNYAAQVRLHLPSPPSTWCIDTIDCLTGQLTDVLNTAARSTIPSKIPHKYKRPGWNDTLKLVHLKSKNAYRAWKASGANLSQDSELRMKYKEAKCIFRRELRKFKRNEQDNFYNSLDFDDNRCFSSIRAHNGRRSTFTNSLSIDDEVYEGACLLDGWALHFERLAIPNWENCCSHNSVVIESRLLDIIQQCADSVDSIAITPDHIYRLIKSLPKGKAVGPDALASEHFLLDLALF